MENRIKCFASLLVAGGIVIGLGNQSQASDDERVITANRLENLGITAWKEGRYQEGASLIEESLDRDPANPQRALNYGSLLMIRGQQQLQEGELELAAATLDQSELQLTSAVRLAEGTPGRRALAGQGFFLLGEIAYFARRDFERATKFYQSAARRLPEDSRVQKALIRVGVESDSVEAVEAISRVGIGMANSVVIEDYRLRLVREESEERVHVKEYLPPSESMDNWSVLFARREHRQFVAPKTYANLLAEQAALQGCRILKTSAGPGESASVAFVIPSASIQLSEINVWHLFVENGRLFSEQFARRVRGDSHHQVADQIAARKVSDWITALQLRRNIGLVHTSVVEGE